MSHIATIDCEVRDLDALAEAARKFHATLHRNVRRFKSYAGGTCEHKVSLDGDREAYEVGVQATKEPGVYSLGYDDWDTQGQKLTTRFGPGLENLQTEYMAIVAENAAREQGAMVEREQLEDGIRLHIYA